MSNDDLVDAFAALFVHLHANANSGGNARLIRLANLAHGIMEEIQNVGNGIGVVKPFDGTAKPPPGP